jgi:hypothetical protein
MVLSRYLYYFKSNVWKNIMIFLGPNLGIANYVYYCTLYMVCIGTLYSYWYLLCNLTKNNIHLKS